MTHPGAGMGPAATPHNALGDGQFPLSFAALYEPVRRGWKSAQTIDDAPQSRKRRRLFIQLGNQPCFRALLGRTRDSGRTPLGRTQGQSERVCLRTPHFARARWTAGSRPVAASACFRPPHTPVGPRRAPWLYVAEFGCIDVAATPLWKRQFRWQRTPAQNAA